MIVIGRRHSDILNVVRIVNQSLSYDENRPVTSNRPQRHVFGSECRSAIIANLPNPEGHLFPLAALECILNAEKFVSSPSNSFLDERKSLVRSLRCAYELAKASKGINPLVIDEISTAWLRCESLLGSQLEQQSAPIIDNIASVSKAAAYFRKCRCIEGCIPLSQLDVQKSRCIIAFEALLQKINSLDGLQELPRGLRMPYHRNTFLQAAFICNESTLLSGLVLPIEFSQEKHTKATKLLLALDNILSTVEITMRDARRRMPSLDHQNYPDLVSSLRELRESFDVAYRSFH